MVNGVYLRQLATAIADEANERRIGGSTCHDPTQYAFIAGQIVAAIQIGQTTARVKLDTNEDYHKFVYDSCAHMFSFPPEDTHDMLWLALWELGPELAPWIDWDV